MKKAILILLLVLAVQIGLSLYIEPDFSHIGHGPHKIHSIFGFELPMGGVNESTIRVSWIIMGVIFFGAFFATRNLKKVPGRLQGFFELIVLFFDGLCKDTLGDRGRLFLPLICSLFVFILLCNWSGYVFLPEPTKDLNTTLGLGLLCFFVAHGASIRYKGLKRYIADYFEPFITIGKFQIPNVLFFPLNVIGELGKVVSHSFRLYGNILGGVIIIEVVSSLVKFVLLPPFLIIFFVFIIGAIQAFVFAMLAMTYIAVLVED